MDRYRMNRPECRANYMNSSMPPQQAPARFAQPRTMGPHPASCESVAPPCGCQEHKKETKDLFVPGAQMSLAIGYVPMQKFNTTFEMCKALNVGTIFPELCKPFVGKRGKKC